MRRSRLAHTSCSATLYGFAILAMPRSIFDASLEFAADAVEMAMHRGACRDRVVRRDGARNGFMITNHHRCQIGSVKMVVHATPKLGALIPQAFDNELERTVACGLGDSHVKIAIRRFAHREVIDVRFHSRNRLLERFDVGCGRGASRKRGNLAFDQLSRAQQLERTRTGVAT